MLCPSCKKPTAEKNMLLYFRPDGVLKRMECKRCAKEARRDWTFIK